MRFFAVAPDLFLELIVEEERPQRKIESERGRRHLEAIYLPQFFLLVSIL